MGGGSFAGLGFSQTELDRSLFFDEVMPQVVDHDSRFTSPVSSATSGPFGPIPGVGLGVAAIPTLRPQVPRERWADANVTSPRGLKRDAGLDQSNVQPRNKVEKTSRTVDVKSKRPSEQADHILRERQRRDDMTTKFAVLESLLPIGIKRDRSTIVDDSIEYVKNLHHRIKALQERKVGLEKTAAAVICNKNGARGARKAPSEVMQPALITPKEETASVKRPPVSQEELRKLRGVLRSCLEKMEVHSDLPHQVVVEMVCRPQPRLQSSILQCLESLSLVVMQCSITKISHRLICVITAKPQESSTPTSGIVAALKYALGSEMQSN